MRRGIIKRVSEDEWLKIKKEFGYLINEPTDIDEANDSTKEELRKLRQEFHELKVTVETLVRAIVKDQYKEES